MLEEVVRTVGSNQDILNGIQSGLYVVWGGVVRVAKGHPDAGTIVAHLKFPSDHQKAEQAIKQLQVALSEQMGSINGNLDTLKNSVNSLKVLQFANLALSGLNLAVSITGFMVVCKKLNHITSELKTHTAQLDQLIALSLDAKQRDEFQNTAKFIATIEAVRQFSDSNDIEHLKPRVAELREQYEYTRLILKTNVDNVTEQNFENIATGLGYLQKRFMYLGLMQCFVQRKISADKYAIEALQRLENDWSEINKTLIEKISSSRRYIEKLSVDGSNKIISFLEYRKEVMPAISYQRSLLEHTQNQPELLEVEDDLIMLLVA